MELVPSGALEGILSTIGLYEECVNIESPMVKWNDIRGKYCLAKVHLPFLWPSFPSLDDELEEGAEPGLDLNNLNNLNSYATKKAVLTRLNQDFDERSEEHSLNSSHVAISYAVFC